MKAKRKAPAATTVDALMIKSRRRCCLCVFLDFDFRTKPLQVAHIDDDPSNSNEENLVVLCLEHHNEYDSRFRQSRRISTGEVLFYKSELERIFEGSEIDKPQVDYLSRLADVANQEAVQRDLFLEHFLPKSLEVPAGEFRIKDEDAEKLPFWSGAISGTRDFGDWKDGSLDYSFTFTHPVSTGLFVLFCLDTAEPLVGQSGGSRSHCYRDFTWRHALHLLFLPKVRYVFSRERLRFRVAKYCGRRHEGILSTLDEPVPPSFDAGLEKRLARMLDDFPAMKKPVGNVTWLEANRFAAWLTSVTGRLYKLPSEVEWMRAVQHLQLDRHSFPMKFKHGDPHQWFWTSDWYTARPSENFSNPLLTGRRVNAKHEWKVLKSLGVEQHLRGGYVYLERAINHGIVLVSRNLQSSDLTRRSNTSPHIRQPAGSYNPALHRTASALRATAAR